MGNARSKGKPISLFATLCLAVAVFSLTAHFIADAACKSPEFTYARQCGSGVSSAFDSREQLATASLHSGFLLPKITALGSLLSLTFALALASAIALSWFFPPPVHPPIACL